MLSGEAWARAHRGEVRPAIDLLEQARGLVEGSSFTDLDRAEILFRLGVARYLISSISTAIALFGEALALVERSPLPSDLLRANVLTWRSRCYRRQRDYEAARDDVTRALELAESMDDTRALGEVYFQASLIAERDGHWVLARTYAERAKSQYEALTDRIYVGRLLNNLGGLEFLLGKPDEAIARLNEAFAIALEHGDDDDAATAISSLAQVHLRTGDVEKAEEHARAGARAPRQPARTSMDEIGNARLVLGRALLEQDRLDEAEAVLAEAEDALRPALIRPAPSRRLGRAGRPGPAPRGRSPRRHPLPSRSRDSPRLQVLNAREEVNTVATRLALLIGRRRLRADDRLLSAPRSSAPRQVIRSISPVSGTARTSSSSGRVRRRGQRRVRTASDPPRLQSSDAGSKRRRSRACERPKRHVAAGASVLARCTLLSQAAAPRPPLPSARRSRSGAASRPRRYSGADGDVAAARCARSRSRRGRFAGSRSRMC